MPTNATMLQKRGTAAEWTAENPILQLGEIGYETDTLKFKFGDGSTAWNSLDYGVGSTDITGDLEVDGTIHATGNISTDGNFEALSDITGASITATTGFVGDGENIINLDADNISTGTLPNARLGTGSTSLTTLGTIATGTWNGTAIVGQYGGTGVNNSGKTITLGGNLTTSGAHATTLTTTGTTGVTLPTTGTLSTLAGSETFTNKTIAGGSNTITGIQSGMVQFCTGVLGTVVDPNVYYFGSLPASVPTTTAATRRAYFPRGCTIKACIIAATHNTAASSETTTYKIKVNNTSETTIGTGIFTTGGGWEVTSNTALSIGITAGDYIEFMADIPTMTTNPTNVSFTATIYFE